MRLFKAKGVRPKEPLQPLSLREQLDRAPIALDGDTVDVMAGRIDQAEYSRRTKVGRRDPK
jgi:hypothetical protein